MTAAAASVSASFHLLTLIARLLSRKAVTVDSNRRVGSIGHPGGQPTYHVQMCAALNGLRLKTRITEVALCLGATFCSRVGVRPRAWPGGPYVRPLAA